MGDRDARTACAYPAQVENERVLVALAQKRAEIVREIEAWEAKLYALDATIRLFLIPDEPPVSLIPPPKPAFKGDLGKLVLDAMRKATAPISAPDLAVAMIVDRGLDVTNRHLVAVAARRVAASLKHYEKRGLLRSRKGPDGKRSGWELAD